MTCWLTEIEIPRPSNSFCESRVHGMIRVWHADLSMAHDHDGLSTKCMLSTRGWRLRRWTWTCAISAHCWWIWCLNHLSILSLSNSSHVRWWNEYCALLWFSEVDSGLIIANIVDQYSSPRCPRVKLFTVWLRIFEPFQVIALTGATNEM